MSSSQHLALSSAKSIRELITHHACNLVLNSPREYSSSRSVGPTIMSRGLLLDMVQLINALAGSEPTAISQSIHSGLQCDHINPRSKHPMADVRSEGDGTRQCLHGTESDSDDALWQQYSCASHVLQLCKMPNDRFHISRRYSLVVI